MSGGLNMLKGINVLVIEDDDMLREALVEASKSKEFTVQEATDGIEGLKKAQSQHFHGILVDMNLPKKMGYEVVQKIRAAGPCKDTVIVVLSGYLKKEIVEELIGKVDKAFTKPADIDEVIATLQALIEKKYKPNG